MITSCVFIYGDNKDSDSGARFTQENDTLHINQRPQVHSLYVNV